MVYLCGRRSSCPQRPPWLAALVSMTAIGTCQSVSSAAGLTDHYRTADDPPLTSGPMSLNMVLMSSSLRLASRYPMGRRPSSSRRATRRRSGDISTGWRSMVSMASSCNALLHNVRLTAARQVRQQISCVCGTRCSGGYVRQRRRRAGCGRSCTMLGAHRPTGLSTS